MDQNVTNLFFPIFWGEKSLFRAQNNGLNPLNEKNERVVPKLSGPFHNRIIVIINEITQQIQDFFKFKFKNTPQSIHKLNNIKID